MLFKEKEKEDYHCLRDPQIRRNKNPRKPELKRNEIMKMSYI
jgi:hypothetical protein